MKILIADDDIIARKMLQRTLEEWGHEVTPAENGALAFQAFLKDHFQIVITDWMMPEMPGPQLVEKIRALHTPDYIYIIMLTAKSEKEDLVTGMDSGADDFMAKPFDKDELRVRLRAGERVIQLEENLSKRNAELEDINQRMKRDLEAAAAIQKSLLPSASPSFKGVKIDWRFRPCDELAGDTLNLFRLDKEHFGFYILDVSGHGVSAALLAVTLSRILSPELSKSSLLKTRDNSPRGFVVNSPAYVANQLNTQFPIEMDLEYGQYFTLLYGILNTSTYEMHYVSCGHPGMIYIPQQSEAGVIKSPDLPIGFSQTHQYEENVLQLSPGDRLYLYSDGISDAENSAQEFYGTRRMLATLQNSIPMSLGQSLDELLTGVINWSKSPKLKDDATLLAIEITD